jgi:hypothetical protein
MRSLLLAATGLGFTLGATSRALPAQRNGIEAEYRALIAANPDDSRALYRLAELLGDHPDEAVSLLQRYTALEPQDAWGFIALGDALGRARRIDEAMAAYDAAERLAAGERDVGVGRARMLARAGRTDAAITSYERWSAAHPSDAGALRELAAQYRRAGRLRAAIRALERAQAVADDPGGARQLRSLRAATAIHLDPITMLTRDSDANRTSNVGGLLGFVGDGLEIGVAASSRRVSDDLESMRLGDTRATLAWRPRATTRILAEVGVVAAPRLDQPTAPAPPGGPPGPPGGPLPSPSQRDETAVVPTGRLRYVWREPTGRARLDLRGSRLLVDASPLLVRTRVIRNEIGGEGELRLVGPVAVRGTARVASISSTIDDNTRGTLGGRLVVATVPILGELTGGWQRMTYDRPSDAGYFSPRWAETAEIGSYREVELDNGVNFAIDLGAGTQRVADWGVPVSAWTPAFRGWAWLGIPFAAGRELRFETEVYDARIGTEVAPSGTRWQYGSLSIGVRWAFR